MNKLKYTLGLAMALVIVSCTDFVEPAIPYKGFDTGAFLRTIASTGSINFFALNTATFDLEVEAVDAENGGTVENVDIFVTRRRGPSVLPEVKVASITKDQFQASSTQYLRASESISITAALTALGLTTAGLTGGDFMEFRLVMTDSKGRTFSNNNLSSDIAGGVFYRSPFFYRVPVVCPSDLAGTYSYTTTNIGCDNCPPSYPGVAGCLAAAPITGNGTLTALGNGAYSVTDATFGQYACAWGDNPAAGVRIIDACNKISTGGADQYGLVYTFTIVSVTSTTLTIDWENDYGDSGRTAMTRTDGKTWPALTN